MVFRFALFPAVLALLTIPKIASAALTLYVDPVAYSAKLTSLAYANTVMANFESSGAGAIGTSFIENGIGFSSPSPMRVSSGVTSSPSFFLGYDDNIVPEFQAGDQFSIALPANSNAISMRVISDTIPDVLSFASMTVDGLAVNTMGAGAALSGSFRSYFLGIVNDSGTISNATVGFTGAGFYRIDDVGVASLAAVPEPSSFVLVATFAMTALVQRRLQRSLC
jgi:hypothetical protein